MLKPWPNNREQRAALAKEMTAQAPVLMADINTLRNQFATAKLTYFKAGDMEYGNPSPPGIDPVLNVPAVKTAIRIEQDRKAKKATAARKRK